MEQLSQHGVVAAGKGLGRVKTPPGMIARFGERTFGTEPQPHALMAAISGLMPMMFMTRVRL
jgi:hypothetical protein